MSKMAGDYHYENEMYQPKEERRVANLKKLHYEYHLSPFVISLHLI